MKLVFVLLLSFSSMSFADSECAYSSTPKVIHLENCNKKICRATVECREKGIVTKVEASCIANSSGNCPDAGLCKSDKRVSFQKPRGHLKNENSSSKSVRR